MKRFGVVLLCAVLLPGIVPSVSAAEAEPCKPTEAESQVMYGSVLRLAEAGVVKLRIDWVDGVDSPVTRASFASMVVRVMGQPDPEVFAAVRPFADAEGHWAAGAVAAALAEGIVTGDPGGLFRPDDYITLNEAKLMLARMLRLGPDLTLSSADKALRRGGVDTTLPCAKAQRITYLQAYTLLDRALSVPYYARFQWNERRIRREFAAGLVYESEDGTRIEAPSWAQIAAHLGSGNELMDVAAVLTSADGSYIKAWGGPQAYHVEVGLYTADGALRRFRAAGSQVPERGYTTIDGTTVYLLAGDRMPDYVVPSLFRSFMEEEFPPEGIRWVEATILSDKAAENAPVCIMTPAEVALSQVAVDRLAKAGVSR